jgi:hypothetical protein
MQTGNFRVKNYERKPTGIRIVCVDGSLIAQKFKGGQFLQSGVFVAVNLNQNFYFFHLSLFIFCNAAAMLCFVSNVTPIFIHQQVLCSFITAFAASRPKNAITQTI